MSEYDCDDDQCEDCRRVLYGTTVWIDKGALKSTPVEEVTQDEDGNWFIGGAVFPGPGKYDSGVPIEGVTKIDYNHALDHPESVVTFLADTPKEVKCFLDGLKCGRSGQRGIERRWQERLTDAAQERLYKPSVN